MLTVRPTFIGLTTLAACHDQRVKIPVLYCFCYYSVGVEEERELQNFESLPTVSS